MNYSIIRCICALVIGVLLVAWPEAAILYLVITIGVLFLVPGLFSLSGYLIRGKQDGSRFPIAGLGSLLFGLWLMIMPAFFVGILMYVLGAVLVLAGISQIVNLSAARSWTVVPGGFFVIPVLVLIAGIVVLFNPFTAAAVPFIILGVSSIVYNPQIQISAESGTKRSIFRQKNKTKRSKNRLHTTLIKPEQKVNEDLCSGFVLS